MTPDEINARITKLEEELETHADNLKILDDTRAEVKRLRDALRGIAEALPGIQQVFGATISGFSKPEWVRFMSAIQAALTATSPRD